MNDKSFVTILVLGTGIAAGAKAFSGSPVVPIRIVVGTTALGVITLTIAEFAPKVAVSLALLIFITSVLANGSGIPKRFTSKPPPVQFPKGP